MEFTRNGSASQEGEGNASESTCTASPVDTERHASRNLRKWGLFLIVLIGCWCAIRWSSSRTVTSERSIIQFDSPPQFQLDANHATAEEFMALPSIGPRLAESIVREREQGGEYTSLDDMQRVRGLGPMTLKSLRPLLRVATNNESNLMDSTAGTTR